MKTHATTKCSCPDCGYAFSAATGVGHEASPRSGDPTICARCGAILMFDEHQAVSRMPLDLLRELDPSDRRMLMRLSRSVREAKLVPYES